MSLSNLESFLRSFQADTDLREFQEPVRDDLDAVQISMSRFFESSIGILQGVAQHLLGVTGKKFRPTLLLLISRMGEGRREDAIFAATVIELIHTATLIHDDTIDRSAIRRGLPTLNALYNDQVSTILGDYIYTKAFVELIERKLPRLVPVVALTTYRMTVGEVLAIEQKRDIDITEDDYFRLVNEKTASLMGAATEIGGLVGGLGDSAVEALRGFGEDLGRAYQVTDDLFDFLGNQGQIGKGVQSDFTAGKVTLPIIHAIRNAENDDRRWLRELLDRREISEADWRRLLGVLESSGAIEYCRTRALDLAEQALGRIEFLPAGACREALEKAVAYSVHRSH